MAGKARARTPFCPAQIPGKIDRTTQASYIRVSRGYLPEFLQQLPAERLLPKVFDNDGVQIGPIPAGTPVNLLANINPLSEDPDRRHESITRQKSSIWLLKMARDLAELPKNASEDQVRAKFADVVEPMLALSKCPDFVVNRGHLFGTQLSDQDKRALIEFLKTF